MNATKLSVSVLSFCLLFADAAANGSKPLAVDNGDDALLPLKALAAQDV